MRSAQRAGTTSVTGRSPRRARQAVHAIRKYPEAAEQCRKALEIDPSDQTVVYRLIQALRKTGDRKGEIPDLLKRLASLREQAIQKDKERYRFKLVD
jgi:two-component SAPR family response regulator